MRPPLSAAGRARAWAAAHRATLVVGGIVVAAATVTILYSLKLAGYFVMPDELGYVQQGHFIAEHLRPVLPHDAEFGSWSQLEPLILALPYGLWATPTAFDLAHAINAVLLASAAVPAYLLMRRLSPWRGGAYLVAGMTVVVPWMTLAGTMLTENVAYPAFLWAVLAAHVTLTDPRPRNDALFVLTLLVAYAARTQLSLVAAAAVVAIVVHEIGWRWRGGPRQPPLRALRDGAIASVRGHWVLVALAGIALLVILTSTSGQLLGGYAAPTEGQLLPPGAVHSAREILAQVVAGIGVLPLSLALAFAFGSLWAPRDRYAQAFAALAIPTVVLMALALGSFSVRFTAGVNDRYLFFLAPLLFCGTIGFLLEKRRWLVPLALGTAGATALVASATLAQRGPSLVSPAAAFHDVLEDLGIGGVPTTAALLGLAVVVAIAIARVVSPDRRQQTLAFGGALLAFLAVETTYTMQKIVDTQHPSQEYLTGRDWVDRALPSGEHAAVLLSNFGDRYSSAATWWDLTFWNIHADRALRVASDDDFIQKTTFPLEFDPRTGEMRGVGARYLVLSETDRRLALAGATPVDRRYGMRLVRLPAKPRVDWALFGTDPAGRLPRDGAAAMFVWSGGRGNLVLRVDAKGANGVYRLHVAGRTVSVRGGTRRLVRLPIRATSAGRPVRLNMRMAGPPPADPATDPGPLIDVLRVPAA